MSPQLSIFQGSTKDMWRAAFPAMCTFAIVGGLVLGASAQADIINVPGDQPTIQAAIDAAVDGDEIVVAPDTYFETINFLGKAVTLRSSDGPEVTIIDATGLGQVSVVICNTSEESDTILDGFTITGGTGTNHDGIPAGGGMHNSGSSPTVINCTFSGNTGNFGGGMFNLSSEATVTNCTFAGNYAARGGGMYCSGGGPTVTNCTFSGNTAELEGGGMLNSGSSPSVSNCSFIGNTATGFSGGGMSNGLSSPTVTNCTFDGNTANSNGGGISNRTATVLTVADCTFSGNVADNGRALAFDSFNDHPNDLSMSNCVLWDGGGEVWKNDNSTISITYSDVQGGWPGVGNIDADPLFADADGPDDIPGTEDDNLRLSPGSPAIDAADNTAVPPDSEDLDDDGDTMEPTPFDLDGNARFVDDPDTPDTGNPDGIHPIVDMGAYEFEPPDPCDDEDGDGRVTICHIPPGNPENAHTITVGVNAVPAHLAHGDRCGACEGDGGLLMNGASAANDDLCSSDLNDSGDVGAADLAELLGAWGPNPDHPADFNGDDVVNAADLAQLLGSWGSCED